MFPDHSSLPKVERLLSRACVAAGGPLAVEYQSPSPIQVRRDVAHEQGTHGRKVRIAQGRTSQDGPIPTLQEPAFGQSDERAGHVHPAAKLAFAGSNAFTVAGLPIAKNAAAAEIELGLAISPSAALSLSIPANSPRTLRTMPSRELWPSGSEDAIMAMGGGPFTSAKSARYRSFGAPRRLVWRITTSD